ncbi:hypothetical protein [Baaleninema simplex]|uniref:hypothetical protein n=1 Tax=Baaleninema simplex TaxID=2862350 RepID=UPI00130E420F|nr:hypothetical protein [Baaleninema simplex]
MSGVWAIAVRSVAVRRAIVPTDAILRRSKAWRNRAASQVLGLDESIDSILVGCVDE